jgi:hypothetical protein
MRTLMKANVVGYGYIIILDADKGFPIFLLDGVFEIANGKDCTAHAVQRPQTLLSKSSFNFTRCAIFVAWLSHHACQ